MLTFDLISRRPIVMQKTPGIDKSAKAHKASIVTIQLQ
jgi:hypothetical protein